MSTKMSVSTIILFISYCLFPTHSITRFTFEAGISPPTKNSYECTDTTGCEFVCLGTSICKDLTMTCQDGANCIGVCTGYGACQSATINCPTSANCNVYCNESATDDWSCYITKIHAESSNQLTVHATGQNIAKKASIWCPNNAQCDLTFIGLKSGVDSTINCGTNGECRITAEGTDSLYGSCATCSTQINADNSDSIVITASGKRALGVELKCPRSQDSSDAQCIIKMISDDTTDYTNGNEILRYNWIYIESATDIQFYCDGNAIFNSNDNEIKYYTNSDNCVIKLINTNDLQCKVNTLDIFQGKQCEAFSTNAPTLTTVIPTTNPSQTPIIEPSKSPTVIPTTNPSQSPIIEPSTSPTLPTVIPTSNPTQSPINPTTKPSKTPTLTSVFTSNPTESPISTLDPTESPIFTSNPTESPIKPESTSIKETTADNTDDEANESEDKISHRNNVNPMTLPVVIASVSFGVISLCFAALIWFRMRRQNEKQWQQHEDRMNKDVNLTTLGTMGNTAGSTPGNTDICTRGPGSPVSMGNKGMFGDKETPGNVHDCMDHGSIATVGNIGTMDDADILGDVNSMDGDTLGNNDLGESKNEVSDWLDQMGMAIYFDVFIENGLSSLEFIRQIGDKNDLYDIGIILKGHQIVIMAEIMKLKAVETEGGGQRLRLGSYNSTSFIVESDDEKDEGEGRTTYNTPKGNVISNAYSTPNGNVD